MWVRKHIEDVRNLANLGIVEKKWYQLKISDFCDFHVVDKNTQRELEQ